MPSAPRPGNLTWGCSELASRALNTDAEAEARPALAEVGTRPWRKKSDCPKARLKQVRQSDTLGSRLHLSCLLRRAACPVLWQKHLSGRLAALGISSAPPDNIEEARQPTQPGLISQCADGTCRLTQASASSVRSFLHLKISL